MKGKAIMFVILIIIGLLATVEIIALLWLKLSVNSHRAYWEKQNNTSQAEVNYIALGDSSAQGVGASRPQKGYVGLLAQKLNAKVINLSVSGAKVVDVTNQQLPKLTQYKISPKTVITLTVGGNDMRDFDPAQFEQQLDELFRKLPKQTIVADIPYFGGGRYRRLELNVEQANKVLHQLAEKHGLKLAELHKLTREKDSLLVYAADWFHPSNTGYKNWFEAFRQALSL